MRGNGLSSLIDDQDAVAAVERIPRVTDDGHAAGRGRFNRTSVDQEHAVMQPRRRVCPAKAVHCDVSRTTRSNLRIRRHADTVRELSTISACSQDTDVPRHRANRRESISDEHTVTAVVANARRDHGIRSSSTCPGQTDCPRTGIDRSRFNHACITNPDAVMLSRRRIIAATTGQADIPRARRPNGRGIHHDPGEVARDTRPLIGIERHVPVDDAHNCRAVDEDVSRASIAVPGNGQCSRAESAHVLADRHRAVGVEGDVAAGARHARVQTNCEVARRTRRRQRNVARRADQFVDDDRTCGSRDDMAARRHDAVDQWQAGTSRDRADREAADIRELDVPERRRERRERSGDLVVGVVEVDVIPRPHSEIHRRNETVRILSDVPRRRVEPHGPRHRDRRRQRDVSRDHAQFQVATGRDSRDRRGEAIARRDRSK